MNIAFKLGYLSPFLRLVCLGAFISFCSLLGGCSDDVRLPSNQELAIFNTAGPIIPAVDKTRIKEASLATGPYRIVIGDFLDVQLPSSLLLNADASDTFVGQNAMSPLLFTLSFSRRICRMLFMCTQSWAYIESFFKQPKH